jgi:hypothetical protein
MLDPMTPTPISPVLPGGGGTPTLDGDPEQAAAAQPGQTAGVSPAQAPASGSYQPPNQYSLQGNEITIRYGWFGSPTVMSYQDSNRSLSFNQATVTEVPTLGTIVSVTIVPGGTDTAETTFSLVVPPVEVPGQLGSMGPPSSVHVETFGIITVAPDALDFPPTYTVINLSGEATANNEPL